MTCCWKPRPLPRRGQRADKAGYDVLGANRELAGAEIELVNLGDADRRVAIEAAPPTTILC